MSIYLVGRVRRWTRALAVVGAVVAGASCSDRSSVGLIAPGHARLALAPRFATVAGAPTVPLSRVEGSLTSPGGDSTFAKADFANGTASLEFDVQLTGDNTDFVLDLVGFDSNGNEAYRAHQLYHLKAGLNDDLDQPVLVYSAPDSKVVSLHVSAGSATLDAGATTKMSVTGTGANEAPISPVRVGWTSRNPTIATVDDSGVVTAAQLTGTTYIVARTPANLADSMLITTRGAVAQVVATPSSITMFRGATTNVTAELRDAAGTVITDRPPTFTSGDEKVATVTAAGVVTGIGVGSTTITATAGGKSVAVPVSVASPVAGVQLTPPTLTLANPGDTQLLTATIVAKPGASVAGLVPTFTTGDATIATVGADGRVTAVRYGTATITATVETFTASSVVSVVAPLTITPGTSEKLPKGTQQFQVTAGGNGPFTWTVHGVASGNPEFGTISETGFYTAPDVVPTQASFDICAVQANPATTGCAKMTINPIPTAGADVIVFNDINFVDLGGSTNVQLFKNLINFTGDGSRAAATGFMIYRGNHSKCQIENFCTADSWEPALASAVTSAGFRIVDVNDPATRLTSDISTDIKAIMLLNPEDPFTNAEINRLKKFASEGGRIIFVGEHNGYYGSTNSSGIDYISLVENPFLAAMGAVLRNPGANGKNPGNGVYACPGTVTGAGIRQHQLSTGVTAVAFACSTEVELGPNDFAIFTFVDQGAERVLVAAAKIDVTPLPEGSGVRVPAKPKLNRSATGGSSSTPTMPPSGPGVSGWKPTPPR